MRCLNLWLLFKNQTLSTDLCLTSPLCSLAVMMMFFHWCSSPNFWVQLYIHCNYFTNWWTWFTDWGTHEDSVLYWILFRAIRVKGAQYKCKLHISEFCKTHLKTIYHHLNFSVSIFLMNTFYFRLKQQWKFTKLNGYKCITVFCRAGSIVACRIWRLTSLLRLIRQK